MLNDFFEIYCDRHSPLALNKLRLLQLANAHYIIYEEKKFLVKKIKTNEAKQIKIMKEKGHQIHIEKNQFLRYNEKIKKPIHSECHDDGIFEKYGESIEEENEE